jgi:hypothetical protein
MKTRKLILIVTSFCVTAVIGIIGAFTLDYLANVNHWRSREGIEELTKIKLPQSIKIIDYKVSAYYSIADRPNHHWLLESEDGFEVLNRRVADFTLGGAESTKNFHEEWPELERKFGSEKVGRIIMGIGTGQETLFISSSGRFAILYAFRS